ncbi:Regulatory protein Spx [Marinomonas spartinae]|uniref:ArsC family reductase n=1 Tax=Marinomonas spartinae TaxID=1792290 RepID=UPI000808B657|nr:ArsC family reductase [Marinomonas spartinae]SBS27753.1 Regulatory protein Spx [Marinomonas spartinae]
MVDIYGIKNCDTMKKAFHWLDENNIEYTFHDYKKEGVNETQAKQWLEQLGWENIINKRGTTWRKLDDKTKDTMNNELALQTIQDQPSIIKRPLLIKNNEIILGFKPSDYQAIFQ